jgi:hypothetical protein
VTGPGLEPEKHPERPVEPYEPDPNNPDPRDPEPDYPGRYPTYEDSPPTEPQDEEPLTLPTVAHAR